MYNSSYYLNSIMQFESVEIDKCHSQKKREDKVIKFIGYTPHIINGLIDRVQVLVKRHKKSV